MSLVESESVREWTARLFREGKTPLPSEAFRTRIGLAGMDASSLGIVLLGAARLGEGNLDGLIYLTIGTGLNLKIQRNLEIAIHQIES